jgi:poly(hydroxyalkanoate) depolymerase family esterase
VKSIHFWPSSGPIQDKVDMNFFNLGATGRPTQAARLSSATDLVQRTLAQHGLTAPNSVLNGLSPAQMSSDGSVIDGDTFTCPQGSRTYRTYVPNSAKDGVAGVIMMLHGCTQNPDDFEAGTGMHTLAETHRLVIVYPGQSLGDNAQICWNWFRHGDQCHGMGEPAILAGFAKQITDQHAVKPHNTYVAGLSAGAAMAVILGETYPDVFAAFGAHSGLPFGAATDMTSAFAAMMGTAGARTVESNGPQTRTIVFHGTADTTVHPSNSDAIARDVLDRAPRQTIDTTTRGETGGRSWTRRIVAAQNNAAVLEQWTIEGLGHAWSGGSPKGSFTDAGGPDASAQMVRFFLNNDD